MRVRCDNISIHILNVRIIIYLPLIQISPVILFLHFKIPSLLLRFLYIETTVTTPSIMFSKLLLCTASNSPLHFSIRPHVAAQSTTLVSSFLLQHLILVVPAQAISLPLCPSRSLNIILPREILSQHNIVDEDIQVSRVTAERFCLLTNVPIPAKYSLLLTREYAQQFYRYPFFCQSGYTQAFPRSISPLPNH